MDSKETCCIKLNNAGFPLIKLRECRKKHCGTFLILPDFLQQPLYAFHLSKLPLHLFSPFTGLF